jgi:small subunit ribosomal protein S11
MADTAVADAPDKAAEKPAEPEQPAAATPAPAAKTRRKKVKRTVAAGRVYVQATFNNTIVSLTDTAGNLLVSSSAGRCGFRGSKKGTAYAAQVASEKAANEARQQYGLTKVDVFVKGIGQGRDAAVRALQNVDIFVNSISDISGLPHGGVRPRKARRA